MGSITSLLSNCKILEIPVRVNPNGQLLLQNQIWKLLQQATSPETLYLPTYKELANNSIQQCRGVVWFHHCSLGHIFD
jgi:hypothetical protein